MGKCQSAESAQDRAADELAITGQSSPKTFADVDPTVAIEKLCITEKSLLEMPENAAELDEDEQISIFSKLLVKNLIAQRPFTVKQITEEEQEEMEIRSLAMTVIGQVIQEGRQKISGRPNVVVTTDEKAEAKPAGDDVPTTNTTDADVVATPCPKCKGTGKTNLMGGARGLSFMKRPCKYCSSGTAAQAAKAGA